MNRKFEPHHFKMPPVNAIQLYTQKMTARKIYRDKGWNHNVILAQSSEDAKNSYAIDKENGREGQIW